MQSSTIAGVPPLDTLQRFDRRMINFRPDYIAPGLTKQNFYRENGQIILAAMVAIMLLISLFVLQSGVFASGTPTVAGYSRFGL